MTTLLLLIAGSGSRLMPYTKDRPKCMVSVAGKSLLERQLEVYEKFKFKQITAVGGYKADQLSQYKQFKLVENKNFASTNISSSLRIGLEAILAEVAGDESDYIIIGYGDIAFHVDVFKKLYEHPKDFVTVVDLEYESLWSKRMPDPLSDLETLHLSEENEILEIGGKPVSYTEIDAQYIGLTKVSFGIARMLLRLLQENTDNVSALSITHFMNYLIQSKKAKVWACPVRRGWVEIDTTLDLENLENQLENFLIPQE